MIIAATGHRPNKLFNYDFSYPGYSYLRKEIAKVLLENKPEKVISGGAQGFDQIFANVALDLKIPVHFYVPFIDQEKFWGKKCQDHYTELLKKAEKIVICSEGGYAAYKMMIRNKKMVNDCNLLLACYNEIDKTGGTFLTLDFAKKVKRETIIINPNKYIKEKENI